MFAPGELVKLRADQYNMDLFGRMLRVVSRTAKNKDEAVYKVCDVDNPAACSNYYWFRLERVKQDLTMGLAR